MTLLCSPGVTRRRLRNATERITPMCKRRRKSVLANMAGRTFISDVLRPINEPRVPLAQGRCPDDMDARRALAAWIVPPSTEASRGRRRSASVTGSSSGGANAAARAAGCSSMNSRNRPPWRSAYPPAARWWPSPLVSNLRGLRNPSDDLRSRVVSNPVCTVSRAFRSNQIRPVPAFRSTPPSAPTGTPHRTAPSDTSARQKTSTCSPSSQSCSTASAPAPGSAPASTG